MRSHFRNFKVVVVSVLFCLATYALYLTIGNTSPANVLNKSFPKTSKSFLQVSPSLISIADRLGLIPNSERKFDSVKKDILLSNSKPVAVRISNGPENVQNMGWNNAAQPIVNSQKPIVNSQKPIVNKHNNPDESVVQEPKPAIRRQSISPTNPGRRSGVHNMDIERGGLVPLISNDNAGVFPIELNNFPKNIVLEKTGDTERYQITKDSVSIQLSESLSQDKAWNVGVSKTIRDNLPKQRSDMFRETIQQDHRHWEDTLDINSMNRVRNENEQQDIRNGNDKFQHISVEENQVQEYIAVTTTTATSLIIKESSDFRVHKFAVFNQTQMADMRHIYTLHNLYLSREARNFPCIPTRTVPSFTICVFSVHKDIYVSGSLQQSGIWDLKQTQLLQKALNEFPEATFIDVGANIGYFSLLARAMGRSVVAIEPTDANFLRLQEGVIRNKFSDNILMLKYAISDERTTVIMSEDDHNQGGIAVEREISGPANLSRSVEALTLDDLVNLILSKEIIIKMDIEGYECKALYSSMELLEKFKVRYIFMEWLIMPQNQDRKDTPCPKANILHTLANMYSMGFKPYSVHGGQLDINNSGSWKTNDIYWKPHDSPTLNDVHSQLVGTLR